MWDDFTAILAEVASRHEGHGGKSHIAAFTPDQQRSARQLVFDYLIDRDMYCCYEAMYVQGLHAAIARANSLPPPDVKRPPNERYSRPRPENPRLISETFRSLIAKAMAYAVEKYGREVTLKVIVDTTDASILEEYREGAMEILDAFKPKAIQSVGWNSTLEKQIVHKARLETKVSTPELEKFLSAVKFEISCEYSGLTFAADVLVGSLRHHLMNKVKVAGTGKLNSKSSTADHVLQHQMYGASELPSEQSLLDIMYRHPERPID